MHCTLCKSSEVEHLKIKDQDVIQLTFGIPILICSTCKFIFADFIHPEVIRLFYKNFCRPNHSVEEFVKLRKMAKESGESQLTTIAPFLPKNIGRVLDFGGGSGEAARLFIPLANEVFISEMDPSARSHIKEEPNLHLLDEETLLGNQYLDSFDLIIFSNVLEHVCDPISILDQLSRLLTKNGQLFIEVPNEAPWIGHNGNHCRQHIGFYSINTFETLISTQGSFSIQELRTCGPKVSDIIKHNSLLHDFGAQHTKNGWVIRALLRNTRQKKTIGETKMTFAEGAEILGKMSVNLFLWSNKQYLQRNQ